MNGPMWTGEPRPWNANTSVKSSVDRSASFGAYAATNRECASAGA